MIVAITKQLFLISSVIITHLGRNPVNGGRPPKDSSIRDIIVRITGILFHESEIELIDVEELRISNINMGMVSKM